MFFHASFSLSNISLLLDEVYGFIISNAFETSLHIKKLVESGQFHAPILVGGLHVGFLVLFMSHVVRSASFIEIYNCIYTRENIIMYPL